MKKEFKLSLMLFLVGYKQSKLHARMMTLFTSIKALDGISERGSRRVGVGLQTAKGQKLLRSFNYTPKHGVLDAVVGKSSFDWTLQRLSVTGFNARLYKCPKDATHLGLTLGVLDFDFDSLASSLRVAPTHFLEVDAESSSFEIALEQAVVPEHVGIVVLGLRFTSV